MSRQSNAAAAHAEWLSLLDVSGPFLSLPVLSRAFPQGLEADDTTLAREVGIAFGEFRDDERLQARWVRWVLLRLLGYPEKAILEAGKIPAQTSRRVHEHGVTLRPELLVVDEGAPRLIVDVWPVGQALDGRVAGESWTASPRERTAELLRGTETRLGLATNGFEWTLVNAKPGESTGYATWDADLWLEERLTLRSFRTVLGIERTLGAPEEEALEHLLDQSAEAQHEVTDQLGKQVRFAIELLISSLDRSDRERHGELFAGLVNEELYLAAVTVMMRLVFLFTAEERELLPLSDSLYSESYAASTLRAQLQEEADRYSEEPLERHSSAWHRLLATFRAVHSGIAHDQLRLPAYGGGLFDPDRFPFLEGRTADTNWERGTGDPLPIDDRTVLHILDALQMLNTHGVGGAIEAQRLSYRSLDVEQIGHVYEGLLDHTALRALDSALGFGGKHEPEISLTKVEKMRDEGEEELCAWLAKETGRSASAIARRLDTELDAEGHARLLEACGGDEALLRRVLPFQALLRTDLRGLPLVMLPGSLYVTQASERRSSGTYYTPRSLAEEVVQHALDPIAYDPGPANEADPERWQLKSSAALLELKICDVAMGSGAFLVATCRYLASRLVEAWGALGEGTFTAEGAPATGRGGELTIPVDPEEQLSLARRLIADRCLYGVDKNQMAVEMAKLSLWLITMAKERPFSFLDHALRAGDSLLGVTDLKQIEHFHIDPSRGAELHGTFFDYTAACGEAVEEALRKRRELEAFTTIELADAKRKERLHREASEALETARLLGDLVAGAALATAESGAEDLDTALASVEEKVGTFLDSERSEEERGVAQTELREQAETWLNRERPPMSSERHCFHWPLEFPEVFLDGREGFDAVVGNPPFLGGTKISGPHGDDYRQHLAKDIAGMATGRADLVAFFVLRAAIILKSGGSMGFLATNTIAQGDTREACLDRLTAGVWSICRAWKSRPWPGGANLEIAQIWLWRGSWEGDFVLDGNGVKGVTTSLDPASRAAGAPKRLAVTAHNSYIGSYVFGKGFVLGPEEADELIDRDPRNRDVVLPYLTGQDLNKSPCQEPSRWVIYFADMDEQDASSYTECWQIVCDRVRPERLKQDINKYPTMISEWWKFWRVRRELYEAIHDFERVLVLPRVSKTLQPVFVRTGQIFSDRLVVFVAGEMGEFGLFSSGFHWWWAVVRGSTLRRDPLYTPTDCFETFPQPTLTDEVGDSGRRLDEHRRELMLARDEGLTKTYNRVHDPNESAEDITELRRLHVELDHAVRDAYGWDDLDLGHGFHETNQGVRYTFEPVARTEILDRLLELNHERYEEEERAGLHAKGAKRSRRGRGKSATGQGTLI